MAIYELNRDSIRKIEETTFTLAGIRERSDLQRLLRAQIEVISPDTLIICEEFGEWQDSRRRIDLLGLDKCANLVVIELKRNEDGSHMELQAIRYAAMVSTMTFEKAVDIYSEYLSKSNSKFDAQQTILDFLDWEEADEDLFAQDVRIILVSAEFSKELTTAVMWLNDRDLDIKCIRMKPYADNGRVLVDVQQIIPLPEANSYQVKIREKERKERKDKAERYILRKRFWTKLLNYARTKTDLHANISPSEFSFIGTGSGIRGLGYNYTVKQLTGSVELYIDRGSNQDEENNRIFDIFYQKKAAIESELETSLDWQKLDKKRACRIKLIVTDGGYRSDESQWQEVIETMVDSMIALEHAMRPHLESVRGQL
jgi:hypothetical protein